MLIHSDAYQKEWRKFLSTVKEKCVPSNPLNVFISYAWETHGADNVVLQNRLKSLDQDLMEAGIEKVFLDLKQMDGNVEAAMKENLAKSQVVIVIATTWYKQRVQNRKTNAGIEYSEILLGLTAGRLQVFPLWLQGSVPTDAIPKELQALPYTDARDS